MSIPFKKGQPKQEMMYQEVVQSWKETLIQKLLALKDWRDNFHERKKKQKILPKQYHVSMQDFLRLQKLFKALQPNSAVENLQLFEDMYPLVSKVKLPEPNNIDPPLISRVTLPVPGDVGLSLISRVTLPVPSDVGPPLISRVTLPDPDDVAPPFIFNGRLLVPIFHND
jgi:hypothetical protein